MENKLQELTEKLYAEGLEKGKSDAASVVAKATADAAAIIKEADQKAAQIVAAAKSAADELARNTASDVRMASLQTISALRSQIESMVVSSVAHSQVSAAFADGSLTKELLISAVGSWQPSDENGVQVIVPENYVQEAKAAVLSKFDHGVDVVFDGKVRVPFRIAPRDGGYYISFAGDDFEAMVSGALRSSVSKLLFDK